MQNQAVVVRVEIGSPSYLEIARSSLVQVPEEILRFSLDELRAVAEAAIATGQFPDWLYQAAYACRRVAGLLDAADINRLR
jgi:hypothetical protein